MDKIPVESDSSPTEIEELVETRPERVPLGKQPDEIADHGMSLHAALRSDIGAVRERNEDSCLMVSFASGGHYPLLPFGLYLVADGMGGHDGGERASRLASRTASRYLLQQIYLPLLRSELPPSSASVEEIMRESVLAAHEAVHPPGYSGNGGTTLTIALVLGQQLYLAHVGDSRAYWLVDGELEPLTRDHSLVQRLQDAGKLTAEEAQNYEYRNVLRRALGQEEELEVDTTVLALPPCGQLLLCSDGLCGQISDSEIQRIMTENKGPDQTADKLVAAALQAGGLDNISAVVVEFDS